MSVQRRSQGAFDLGGDLVGTTEHVGVVEVDLADTARPDRTPERSARNMGASSLSRMGSSR